jgi:hypothetical protein
MGDWYSFLVEKPEGKLPVGSPRCGWEDNIKTDLGEIEWGGVDCIGPAQDKNKWRDPVYAIMNLRLL